MKTRTLLLLAVGCGLIILIAGSIKLLLVADDVQPTHLAVGQSADIGDMDVKVVSATRSADLTLVTVELIGVDDAYGARSWVLGSSDGQLRPESPPAGVGAACSATKALTLTQCVLAFRTVAATGVLRYERDDETRRWDIVHS